MTRTAKARNGLIAASLAGVVVLMTGAAFAAVPLYRLFCQVTGFDGTTQRASVAATKVSDREVTVRFDANVRDLPWTFAPEQVSQTVHLGETKIAFFKVSNTSDKPLTGTAMYNVVPESAGAYFQKLHCFCFDAQTIPAGATVEFPMLYFVDPEMAADFETRGVGEITLSYTFFPTEAAAAPAKTAAAAPETLEGERRAGL